MGRRNYRPYAREGITRIEAEPEWQERWVAHVNKVADGTLFPRANSWYIGPTSPESRASSCPMSAPTIAARSAPWSMRATRASPWPEAPASVRRRPIGSSSPAKAAGQGRQGEAPRCPSRRSTARRSTTRTPAAQAQWWSSRTACSWTTRCSPRRSRR